MQVIDAQVIAEDEEDVGLGRWFRGKSLDTKISKEDAQ